MKWIYIILNLCVFLLTFSAQLILEKLGLEDILQGELLRLREMDRHRHAQDPPPGSGSNPSASGSNPDPRSRFGADDPASQRDELDHHVSSQTTSNEEDVCGISVESSQKVAAHDDDQQEQASCINQDISSRKDHQEATGPDDSNDNKKSSPGDTSDLASISTLLNNSDVVDYSINESFSAAVKKAKYRFKKSGPPKIEKPESNLFKKCGVQDGSYLPGTYDKTESSARANQSEIDNGSNFVQPGLISFGTPSVSSTPKGKTRTATTPSSEESHNRINRDESGSDQSKKDGSGSDLSGTEWFNDIPQEIGCEKAVSEKNTVGKTHKTSSLASKVKKIASKEGKNMNQNYKNEKDLLDDIVGEDSEDFEINTSTLSKRSNSMTNRSDTVPGKMDKKKGDKSSKEKQRNRSEKLLGDGSICSGNNSLSDGEGERRLSNTTLSKLSKFMFSESADPRTKNKSVNKRDVGDECPSGGSRENPDKFIGNKIPPSLRQSEKEPDSSGKVDQDMSFVEEGQKPGSSVESKNNDKSSPTIKNCHNTAKASSIKTSSGVAASEGILERLKKFQRNVPVSNKIPHTTINQNEHDRNVLKNVHQENVPQEGLRSFPKSSGSSLRTASAPTSQITSMDAKKIAPANTLRNKVENLIPTKKVTLNGPPAGQGGVLRGSSSSKFSFKKNLSPLASSTQKSSPALSQFSSALSTSSISAIGGATKRPFQSPVSGLFSSDGDLTDADLDLDFDENPSKKIKM